MGVSTIFYVKKGRRYVPVREYDSDCMDAFPYGNHLVSVEPNRGSRRYNIDPNHAAVLAGILTARDAIIEVLLNASEMRPRAQELTQEQQTAWEKLREVMGTSTLEIPCANDVCEAAMNAITKQANWLMSNPTVRDAYDQFMMVCTLTSESAKD